MKKEFFNACDDPYNDNVPSNLPSPFFSTILILDSKSSQNFIHVSLIC